MDLNDNAFIAWFLIIAFFIILTLHIFENKKLKIYLQQKCKEEPARQILRFSWSRTLQLLSVMFFSFALIIFYNWQVNNYQEQVANLQNTIIKKYTPLNTQPNMKEQYYPPTILQNGNVADNKIAAPVIQKGYGLNQENTIHDIYGSERNTAYPENAIDDIKTRYEGLIVTYLIMDKCGKAKASDYQLIMQALQKEITKAQAPIHLQDAILSAAKGSYEELYSQNDCSKADVDITARQYNVYINKLLEKPAGQ